MRWIFRFARPGVDAENKPGTFVGKGLHVFEHVPTPPEEIVPRLSFQDKQRHSELQSETTSDDAEVDLLSVVAHRPGEAHHHELTFNLPHVTLVDTAPRGVNLINERGVVHDGKEYPLDVLIYATGFQWMATSTFNMIKGRGGRSLSEKWLSEGTKTFLGLHSHGFPNLFIVSGPQGGGGSFNFTDAIDEHSDYVVWMLSTMREQNLAVVDIKQAPEEAYAEHCREADTATAPLRDCITYYNGHGEAQPGSLAYYGGGRWHKFRIQAQESLEPYEFER